MKSLVTFALIVFCFVVQTVVLNQFNLWGARPDLSVALLISLSILNGSLNGAASGFFYGMFMELFYGVQKGIYIVEFALLGFLAGLIGRRIYLGSFFRPAVFAFTVFVVNAIIDRIIVIIFIGGVSITFLWIAQVLLSALMTALLMIPVHLLNTRLHRIRFMRLASDNRIFLN